MNVEEVLKTCNIDFRRHGESRHVREGWVGVVCPFCDRGQGNYGLGINLTTGAATCWKSGKHSLAEVLRALTHLPYEQIRGLLDDFSPVLKKPEVAGRLQLPKGIGPLLKPHRRYLERRGFDPDEIAEVWGVQGIGAEAKLPWRLFIPISVNGRTVVSWTARSILDSPLRYVHAKTSEESMSRRQTLYTSIAQQQTHGSCVVVEGPIDAWAVGPGAVATLGSAYSRAQVELISRYPVRAVCFDRDAQQQAERLCHELEVLPGETYRVVLSGKDPAESPRKELRELRRRFLD